VFCFPYKQGKTNYPICEIPITNWQKLKLEVPMKINPLVLSLGDAFDTIVDLAICVEKKGEKMKKKLEKQVDKHIMEVEKDFDFDNEINNEDEQVGLVKWCAKQEFKRGKTRSIDTSHELDGLVEQNKCLNVAMLVTDFDFPKRLKRKKVTTLHVELPKRIIRNNAFVAPTPNEKILRHCTRRDGHKSIVDMSKILKML